SSRRRHTRSKRDWSSDVCSSDLRTVQTNHYTIILYRFQCFNRFIIIRMICTFRYIFHIDDFIVLIKDKHTACEQSEFLHYDAVVPAEGKIFMITQGYSVIQPFIRRPSLLGKRKVI